MKDELSSLQAAFDATWEGARDERGIQDLKVQFLGKKGSVTALLKGLGKLPPEERQAFTFFQKRFTVLKRERNRIAKLRIRSASVVVPPKKGALAALAIGAAAQSDDYEMDEEEGLDEEVAALAVEEARREAGEAPEHDAPAERSAEKDTFIESDDPEAEPRR